MKAFPGFHSIKGLHVAVYLIFPQCDASPLHNAGFPITSLNSLVPIYTPEWREAGFKPSGCPGTLSTTTDKRNHFIFHMLPFKFSIDSSVCVKVPMK